jgi:hypothetical protein
METKMAKKTTVKPSKAVRLKTRIAKMETRNKMAVLKMEKRTAKVKEMKARLASLKK